MLITDKKTLRKHFKEVRKAMTLHQRRVCDIEIFNKVINLKEYKNSKEILLYVSSEIEVDTGLEFARLSGNDSTTQPPSHPL